MRLTLSEKLSVAVFLVGITSWLGAWWTGSWARPRLFVVAAHLLHERQKLQEADLSFELSREKPAEHPVLRPQDAVGRCTAIALKAGKPVDWRDLSLPRPGDSSRADASAMFSVLGKSIGMSLERRNPGSANPRATSDPTAQMVRNAGAATDSRNLDAIRRFLVDLADTRAAYGPDADTAVIDFGNEISKNLAKRLGEKLGDTLGSSPPEKEKREPGKTDPEPACPKSGGASLDCSARGDRRQDSVATAHFGPGCDAVDPAQRVHLETVARQITLPHGCHVVIYAYGDRSSSRRGDLSLAWRRGIRVAGFSLRQGLTASSSKSCSTGARKRRTPQAQAPGTFLPAAPKRALIARARQNKR